MGIVEYEFGESTSYLSPRQLWANYLTIAVAVIGLVIGLYIRHLSITTVETYVNSNAGINAEYPRGWLLDQQGDYVFRVRNMSDLGYKTTIQVTSRPVGENTSARNVLDSLSLNRAQVLTDYSPQPAEEYLLPDGDLVQAMNYTYVAREESPFLESIPSVIRGVDLVKLIRGQAIIITFRADTDNFQKEFSQFEQFLESLKF